MKSISNQRVNIDSPCGELPVSLISITDLLRQGRGKKIEEQDLE